MDVSIYDKKTQLTTIVRSNNVIFPAIRNEYESATKGIKLFFFISYLIYSDLSK